MDSLFSFPVGLFHPLQHAGLSRRSTYHRVPFTLRASSDLEFSLFGMPTYPELEKSLRFRVHLVNTEVANHSCHMCSCRLANAIAIPVVN
jgi:hypothetical protein